MGNAVTHYPAGTAGLRPTYSKRQFHWPPHPVNEQVTTMRTRLRLIACAALLIAVAAPVRAQGILDRMKKKAQDAVEKKAEDKVGQMMQKMVESSFASMFGDSASAGASGGGGGGMPFSIGSNARTEASYTFNVVETMEIESSKRTGKGDGKAVMMMHFNTNEAYTGTSIVSADGKKPEGLAFVVLDAKNQAMVMLMASEKSKFSITYDWKDALKYAQSTAGSKEKVNWDTVKVWRSYTKIGSKTIAGFSAEGYRSDSPEANIEIWVSRDARIGVGNMFAANSGLKQMKGRLPADYPQGMMLEMTSTNNSSGEKVAMRVTNIDTNAHVTYAMAEYPKMEMGKR
jgi:hypothetical protein